jgi:hypothetical protein
LGWGSRPGAQGQRLRRDPRRAHFPRTRRLSVGPPVPPTRAQRELGARRLGLEPGSPSARSKLPRP